MKTLTLCTLLALLAACGGEADNKPKPQLFQQERSVLDKAKGVDAAQQQQDEAQRQAIEQQTR